MSICSPHKRHKTPSESEHKRSKTVKTDPDKPVYFHSLTRALKMYNGKTLSNLMTHASSEGSDQTVQMPCPVLQSSFLIQTYTCAVTIIQKHLQHLEP